MSRQRGTMLAGHTRVERLLDRLAAAIGTERQADTALVGILRRGAPLAHRLAERLGQDQQPPVVGELTLKHYSDQLEQLYDRPHLDASTLDLDVAGRHLMLVDDVLYTGESLFRAACHLRAAGARHLQIAVLCARGRPRMPIRADFVGLNLDVGEDWVVECHVPPYEADLSIHVVPRPADAG